MNKKLSAILEYGVLVLACVLLVAFMGTPDSEEAVQTRRAAPAIAQQSEPWDRNLALPKQSDRIANYTMDVKLDTAKNIVSGWEILEWDLTNRNNWQVASGIYICYVEMPDIGETKILKLSVIQSELPAR